MDRSDVFMSYRRTDVEFVKQLDVAFRKEGKEVWIDWEDIPPGAVEFTTEIRRGIEGADAFVAVLSPDYLGSTYCVDLELGYATKLNKRIIPVVLHKVDGHTIPQAISHINWIYFTPHAGQENPFDAAFANVLEALVADFDYVRDHTRLLTRAQRWQEHEHHRNYLLNSGEVAQAEAWLAKGVRLNPPPTELHSDFILASREAATRSQRRVRTIGAVIIALMAVMLVVALFLGYEARNQRETAEQNYQLALTAEAEAITQRNDAWNTRSLFLADSAQDQLEAGSPQDSLVLALESLHHYSDGIYNYESQLALLDALANPVQEELFIEQDQSEHEAGHLLWSADESQVLSWGSRTATIYSLTDSTAEPITFQHNARVEGGYWSPDETQVLTWSNIEGECAGDCIRAVTIWDVANPSDPLVTLPHDERVEGAEWDYEAGQVLTWSNSGGRCDNNCNYLVMLWDINAPDTPEVVLPHQWPLRGATFAQDGSYIVTWTDETIEDSGEYLSYSSVYVWDPADPAEPLWSYSDLYADYGPLDGIRISGDHRYLLGWSVYGVALVWDLDAPVDSEFGYEPLVLEHEAGVIGADWVDDGSTVLTWQEQYTAIDSDGLREVGGTIQFWDLSEPDQPYATLIHNATVHGANLSYDGSVLVSWGEDGYVRLWVLGDYVDPDVPLISLAHRGPVYDAILSSNGDHMLTRSAEGIHLWNLNNETIPFHYLPASLGLPNPDGTLMLMVPPPDDYALPALMIDLTGSPDDTQIIGDDQIYAYSATWSPDGTQVALAEYCECDDGQVDIYSMDDLGTPLASLPGENVLWKGDGSRIVTWYEFGHVYVWDAASLQTPLREFRTGGDAPVDVVMSENGERFFIADDESERYVLWDMADLERPVFVLDEITAATPILNADGQRLVLASGRGALVWDFAQSMQLMGQISMPELILAGSFSGSGDHIALLSSDERLLEYRLSVFSFDDLSKPALDQNIRYFAWHPDGERLVVLPDQNDVEIWNINDLTGPQLVLPTGPMRTAYWSQDGESLFLSTMVTGTATAYGVAYYWSLAQPEAPQFAIPDVGLMQGAILSPDGEHVLTWSAANPARWWPLNLDVLISVGQQRVLRTFNEEQGEEYFVDSEDMVVDQEPQQPPLTFDFEEEFGSVETDFGIPLPDQQALPAPPGLPGLPDPNALPDGPDSSGTPGRDSNG